MIDTVIYLLLATWGAGLVVLAHGVQTHNRERRARGTR